MWATLNIDTDKISIQILSGDTANRIKWLDIPLGIDCSVGIHNYVIVYDGLKTVNSLKLYVDGVEVARFQSNGNLDVNALINENAF